MIKLLRLYGIEWKEARRSPLWHKNLIVKLLLAFTFIYLFGMFVFLGVILDDLMIKLPFDEINYNTYKESFVLRRLNQFLLYYFLADLIMRYFMQKLPALAIQPLLHLPIPKSGLAHFLLGKSLLSPLNWGHALLFVPFIIELYSNLSFAEASSWTLAIAGVVVFNNFFLTFIKRTSEVDWRVFISMLVLLSMIIAAHWFDLIDFLALSADVFNACFLQPITAVIPWVLALLFYGLNFYYLKSNLYLSKLSKSKRSKVTYVGAGILSRFGVVGRLAEMEFKLIWRHKRTRTVLLMTILFLGYGLLVFPLDTYQGNYLMYVLFSLIITGMFILNYGQYLLGWEGSYFDHIITRNVSFEDFYMSKFLVFIIVSAAAMLLSIPYAFFGWKILMVLFSVFLFNIGLATHVVMFFGSLNPKKIDLNAGSVLNWQGVGAAQFLLAIPVMGIPLGLFRLGVLLGDETLGLIFIAVAGLIGLFGTRIWIKMLAKWLFSQRYKIAKDFRNQ